MREMFHRGHVRMNYPSRDTYPIHGLDISHHQGEIDWPSLQTEEFKFIYIKATEGGDFKDKRFQENLKNARQHGFLTGAYHFYTFCRPADDQANNFIDSVPIAKGMLAPAIDLEFGGNCSKTLSQSEMFSELKVIMDKLSVHYGIEPVLYVTTEFYDAYFSRVNTNYKFWVRSIYGRPTFPSDQSWVIWQYANRGHANGIEGFVDMNVFNGDIEQFKTLVIEK